MQINFCVIIDNISTSHMQNTTYKNGQSMKRFFITFMILLYDLIYFTLMLSINYVHRVTTRDIKTSLKCKIKYLIILWLKYWTSNLKLIKSPEDDASDIWGRMLVLLKCYITTHNAFGIKYEMSETPIFCIIYYLQRFCSS